MMSLVEALACRRAKTRAERRKPACCKRLRDLNAATATTPPSEAEAQADAFAIARLRAAHIPTRPAADLFRAMQKTSSKEGEGKPRKFAVEPPRL